MRGALVLVGALMPVMVLPSCRRGSSQSGGSTTTNPASTASASTFAVGSTSASSTSGPSADSPLVPLPVPPKFAACEKPPVGMACIPGGAAIVGADDAHDLEKPRHSIEVSTFYLDRTEVTNADYAHCVAAGGCREVPPAYATFQTPKQPAVPMQWENARSYCQWIGKRLPTEAEWEKAARGGEEARTYPWGNDAPSCEKASYKGCLPDVTRDVGSFPAGAYGLFDLAGNGYEWVSDWASACYDGCEKPCGAACLGLDPMGPCDGAPSCEGHYRRVLKGGSWYWPADEIRASWRRPEMPESHLHRLSFRCAARWPELFSWPPRALMEPRPTVASLSPPSKQALRLAASVAPDSDILAVKPCEDKLQIGPDCRDATSYISTNEENREVWIPYLKNLGGGYVGVGADQSYDLIAIAKSEWVWLLDYDPSVVRVHQMLRALIRVAESPSALITLFSKENSDSSRALIEASIEDPDERTATGTLFANVRPVLGKQLAREMEEKKGSEGFGWLRVPEHYAWMRTLYLQERIQLLKGNILTDKAMPSIAAAARSLGVTVRVYYPSNAEEMWRLSPRYRENVRALPFDDRSLVVRTVSGKQFKGKTYSYWHYVVHGGLHAQWLLGKGTCDHVWCFMTMRHATEVDNLSAIGLFATTPRE